MFSDKAALRREYAARRAALSGETRAGYDAAIRATLSGWSVFRASPAVAAFAALGAEPELLPLAAGKTWFLPRYSRAAGRYELAEIRDPERDLAYGKYGIREPRPELPALPETQWRELLFLIPALACDRSGVRLGRGGGYYDRMLQLSGGNAVAVVYDCQIAEKALPCEAHDRRVAWIVTETSVVDCFSEKNRDSF